MPGSKGHSDKTMRIDIDPDTVAESLPAAGHKRRGDSAHRQPWSANHKQRNSPFYRLLESIYDAVLITSLSGQILECNERAAEFFILPAEELAGRNIITLISGATESLIATIHKNLVDRKYTLIEARCKRADNTAFAAEIAVNKVGLDEEGQLCFFVRDITVRQQAQQALHDAVERLQAHDRARMEFVSNVSHELRTPLTSMIYAVNNMLRGVVGPMPEKALNYLERLQSDSQRLLATVNDILDLRQIENRTLVLSRAIVPLGAVAREGAETLMVQADAKRINLEIALGKRELFCWCDERKIERVILNIVGNAVKFTGENGVVRLTMTPDPDNPGHALVIVQDTGMGIPQEILPRISQRYFRVGDHISGSGLGLAISREIIELHGGSLRFASPVPGSDHGTAVYVTLPLAPRRPQVVAVTRDRTAAALVEREVSEIGYALLSTDSPDEALKLCLEQPPAVLLLDCRNSGMDARDMTLILREHVKTRRLPVIMFGPGTPERVELETFSRLGLHYIAEPWQEDELARTLAKAVLGKLR